MGGWICQLVFNGKYLFGFYAGVSVLIRAACARKVSGVGNYFPQRSEILPLPPPPRLQEETPGSAAITDVLDGGLRNILSNEV